jgi:hypothetical protein
MVTMNSYASVEKQSEQKFIEILDTLCVKNHLDFDNIPHIVKLLSGKKIPDSSMSFDPTIRNNNGKAYFFEYANLAFMVAYAKNLSCSIAAREIDPYELSTLIIENYQATLSFTDNSGMQISNYYKVHSPAHEGAILTLNYPKAAVKSDFATVGFIPYHIAVKLFNNR